MLVSCLVQPQVYSNNNYINYISNKNNNQNLQPNSHTDLNKDPKAIYNVSFSANLSTPVITKLERFEGCLFGGAIGDAFGAKIEMMSLDKIKALYGKASLKYIPKTGDKYKVTDDTQMTLFTTEGLLKSLLKNNNLNVEPDYNEIYKSYLNWYKTQTADFADIKDKNGIMSVSSMFERHLPGRTCLEALKSNIMGTLEAPINNSAGNGGIMRIAPVGILYNHNPELAFKIGVKCAAMTHGNPRAYLPAGFQASLIAELINGKSLNEAIEKSIKILKEYKHSEYILAKIEQGINLAKTDLSPLEAINLIGKGNTGDEALSIALYSILKNSAKIKASFTTAINHSGDSDTIGAITGNILGAMNGIKEFPRNWKDNIEYSEWMNRFAKALNFSARQEESFVSTDCKSITERWNDDKLS